MPPRDRTDKGTVREATLAGPPPVPVRIRRSKGSRRMSLRVSALDGRVTLSLPLRVRLEEGMAFLRDREEWIRQALARTPAALQLRPGEALPVEGRPRLMAEAPVLRVTLEDDRLLVPPGAARFAPRVAAFLRGLAAERLEAACARYGEALGRHPTAVVLRDTRSRWGSCTVEGRLMFSWRLILAPPEVLDYVAAHEVAHLAHMDHSPAFWAVVAGLVPDYQRHRRWLAANGAGLHAWQVR